MKNASPSHQFARLPEDEKRQLTAAMRERFFQDGETIFDQGADPGGIYLLAEGRVAIRRVTADGFESVLCIRRPGEYFCPVSALDQKPQLGRAIALGDVRIFSVDRQIFADLCQNSPQLLQVIHEMSLDEVRRLAERLEMTSYRSVSQRLAAALIAEGACLAGEEGTLQVQATQQDLGAMIGAARESVSRAMRKTEQQGWLSIRRGKVIINDPEALRRIAGDPASQEHTGCR